MSSPRLNNLIVVGCIMTYFSVILFGLDGGLVSTQQYGKVCIVRKFIYVFIGVFFEINFMNKNYILLIVYEHAKVLFIP